MACLNQKSILELPDEVIEEIMTFLSFCDLFNLSKQGTRMEDCAKRVLKNKPFKIAIIGGYNGKQLDNVEVISIAKDSISHIITNIPSLPKGFLGFGGTRLPNGDLLLSEGYVDSYVNSDRYLQYRDGSEMWTKAGTMSRARYRHSSVFLDGYLITTGGLDTSFNALSLHEQFSISEGVKERKCMPIGLYNHTATVLSQNKILVCGGSDNSSNKSGRTFIYDSKEDSWTTGPSLVTARHYHSSCAIQSDDGSTQNIIIIGGETDQESLSKSTEILNIKEQKWVPGPELPCGIRFATCTALPQSTNFACVVVGGQSEEENYSSKVYALSKIMSEWTVLGNIRIGRYSHIAIPIS